MFFYCEFSVLHGHEQFYDDVGVLFTLLKTVVDVLSVVTSFKAMYISLWFSATCTGSEMTCFRERELAVVSLVL